MIYIVLLFFIIISSITYNIFRGDVLSPAFVLCITYTFSVAIAALNKDDWGVCLSEETSAVLVFGTIYFVLISFLIKYYFFREKKGESSCNEKIIPILISKKKLCFLVMFQVFTIFAMYSFFKIHYSYLGEINFDNITVIFKNFRYDFSYSDEPERVPVFLAQANRFAACIAYVCIYIYVHNKILEVKKIYKSSFTGNLLLLLAIFSYFPLVIFSGGRADFIYLLIFLCVITYLLYKNCNGWKSKSSPNTKLKLVGIIMIVMLFFYYMGSMIGRDINYDFIDYISMYLGGSIQFLNLFIQDPIPSSDIVGKETFYSFYEILIRYFNVKIPPYMVHLEFRFLNPFIIGNVYTSYRNWIYDFGYMGILVFQAFTSIFITFFYYKIRYVRFGEISLWLLLYCRTVDVVFLHFFAGQIIGRVFSVSYICYFIYLWIILKFLNFNTYKINWNIHREI